MDGREKSERGYGKGEGREGGRKGGVLCVEKTDCEWQCGPRTIAWISHFGKDQAD